MNELSNGWIITIRVRPVTTRNILPRMRSFSQQYREETFLSSPHKIKMKSLGCADISLESP